MDQASLNKILYDNLDLVNFFNSEYNYLIKNSPPLINKNNFFCIKDYPYNKIKILHLTGIDKNKLYEIKTIEGNKVKTKFQYEIK